MDKQLFNIIDRLSDSSMSLVFQIEQCITDIQTSFAETGRPIVKDNRVKNIDEDNKRDSLESLEYKIRDLEELIIYTDDSLKDIVKIYTFEEYYVEQISTILNTLNHIRNFTFLSKNFIEDLLAIHFSNTQPFMIHLERISRHIRYNSNLQTINDHMRVITYLFRNFKRGMDEITTLSIFLVKKSQNENTDKKIELDMCSEVTQEGSKDPEDNERDILKQFPSTIFNLTPNSKSQVEIILDSIDELKNLIKNDKEIKKENKVTIKSTYVDIYFKDNNTTLEINKNNDEDSEDTRDSNC